jgi:hypothetical protein
MTGMSLAITPQGHSFGASVFHVLRMSIGVRTLWLTFVGATSCPEVILSLLCLSDTCMHSWRLLEYVCMHFSTHISLHTEV